MKKKWETYRKSTMKRNDRFVGGGVDSKYVEEKGKQANAVASSKVKTNDDDDDDDVTINLCSFLLN